MKFILGKKLNMTSVYAATGEKIPVTVIEAGPCRVVQVKTADRDGYQAVQVGFGGRKRVSRALSGHYKNGSKFRYVREFRVSDGEYAPGQEVTVKEFERGDIVDAQGIMKGRGFAGPVKRHGFHGAPASHGHDHPRAVGSIGSRFPQHTLKGTRMAGRMGGHNVTVKNLTVIDIDPDRNLLFVSGAIPGASGGLVKIRSTGAKAKQVPELFAAVSAASAPETTEEQTSPQDNPAESPAEQAATE